MSSIPITDVREIALSLDRGPIAALPMYDLPELQGANDALWQGLVRHLSAEAIEAPRALTRDLPLEAICAHPGLLLTQTCGYPLMTVLGDQVQLVATPRYRALGCAGPFHRSAIVVSAASSARALRDLRGGRCAVNDMQSNTGMNLFRAELAEVAASQPFFAEVQVTGAHLASLEAVAAGRADVAAIDSVTFAHLQRLRPQLVGAVKILSWTRSSPGLPLVTNARAAPQTVGVLRRALTAIVADPSLDEARRTLLIEGFDPLPGTDYGVLLEFEQDAIEQGYPRLR
jgi:ABC-type phosphate/phosphonate transport system substrate-binding protein